MPGVVPPVRFPPVREGRLSSGLHIRTVEHAGPSVVTCLLTLPVGSASDPDGKAGLVALTADLLDEGSVARPSLALHAALDRIGARLGTEVGTDTLTVALTTLGRFAAEGLRLLAEIVVTPRFDDGDVDRVRQLRRSRLRQLRTVPGAVADRVFLETLYPAHPYGHVGIGTDESLEGLDGDDVRGLHQAAFRLGSATLVAVGALSHQELVEAAEQAFADVPTDAPDAAVVVDPSDLPPPGPASARLVVVDRPGAVQTELRIGHVGVARHTPDYHALLALNLVLGGQFSSRLNQRLREEKGYTYGVRSAFDCRRAPGPFAVEAGVQADATVESVREVLAQMSAIGDERPVTSSELDLARAALTRGFARGFETAGQVARGIARLVSLRLPADYYDTFVPLVESVEIGGVTTAARRHLRAEDATVVAVGPLERCADALADLGLGPPTIVEA
jgi:zinc protease